MLSPENYIRKKSRTLPIYECTINSDWEESLIAQISIARQHTTGNVTACFYLVDLLCLGVKDSDFMFNAPMHAYREHIENVGTKLDISKIDYDLAHKLCLRVLTLPQIWV